MYRIYVINPVGTKLWNKSDEEYLTSYLSPGFELDVASLEYGPYSLESSFDESIASSLVAKEALKAERLGYHAVLINCFMDPGIDASREIVNIPVIGSGESSLYLACMLGERFSILGVGGVFTIRRYGKLVHALGLMKRIASIRSIELPVLELDVDRNKTFKLLLDAGNKAINEDGADVLILGCTGLRDFTRALQSKLRAPVIDAAISGLKMAEVVTSLSLSHSKLAYPSPHRVPRILPGFLSELRDVGCLRS